MSVKSNKSARLRAICLYKNGRTVPNKDLELNRKIRIIPERASRTKMAE